MQPLGLNKVMKRQTSDMKTGGGGTPIYGLYRYVPQNRVWFLIFSVLK